MAAIRWIMNRSFPIRDAAEQIYRTAGVSRDITEQKQSEDKIQQLNQTLEQQNLELEALVEQRTAELMTFINALPDYIFVVERETMRMAFCNDAIARLIGWESRHQVNGKTVFECFAPEVAATFAEQNQQVFASGETLHFQECYTRLWVHCTLIPIRCHCRSLTERCMRSLVPLATFQT